MDDPIVSYAHIEGMARTAFERGDERTSCPFKHGARARTTWLEEWDRCAAVAKADRELCGVDA